MLRLNFSIVFRVVNVQSGCLYWPDPPIREALWNLGRDDGVSAMLTVAGVTPFHPGVLAAVLVLAFDLDVLACLWHWLVLL